MSYPGSKGQAGVFQRIIGQMPPHDTYVEPFFGSGRVFRIKRKAGYSILIDRDLSVLPDDDGLYGLDCFCRCAIEWLETVFYGKDMDTRQTVIYCDPPYLLSMRQNRFYYDYEMTDKQHETLLAILFNLKANVLISGYPSKLYDDMLKGWRCISYRTRTRGRTLTECLWCNFPEPTELHDWRFAGRNFRERLSLKRLAVRYLARLDAMPPRKRGYVLHAIHQRQIAAGNVNPGAGGHE